MIRKALKILIIDDDKLMLRALSKAISRSFSVDEVVTLNDPLLVESYLSDNGHTYDLIVSDYQMPDLNGKDVLNIAKHYSPKSIRIMMSGNIGELYQIKDDIPANHFLKKPFDKNELLLLSELITRTNKIDWNEEQVINLGMLPYFPTPSANTISLIEEIHSLTQGVEPQLESQINKAIDILNCENGNSFQDLPNTIKRYISIAYFLSLELIHVIGVSRQNEAMNCYLTWSSQAYCVAKQRDTDEKTCERIFVMVFIGYIDFLINEYFALKADNDFFKPLDLSSKFLLLWGVSEHLISERARLISLSENNNVQDLIVRLFIRLTPNNKAISISSITPQQMSRPNFFDVLEDMRARRLVLEEA
ncbi:response regulator [Pseudoalteromonas luteoviolacea]|uniref:response regulator n=1 Tax=Pseudoalteromonas luteoviolacea TaxID=43657 RepID=UPI001151F537|nr:response regulator [Pseudoalteromonas luteoviolacea]TQF67301.1 response regulator [Pseudoalteromonas luteoviolacea]